MAKSYVTATGIKFVPRGGDPAEETVVYDAGEEVSQTDFDRATWADLVANGAVVESASTNSRPETPSPDAGA